jgi:2-oxo-4-hydroxy-4-carboxy-5-ureidoimidazoline decarboxylase
MPSRPSARWQGRWQQPSRCLRKPSNERPRGLRYGGGVPDSRRSPGQDRELPGLARLNALPDGDAFGTLLGCCSAPGWAQQVAAGRPYASLDDLLAAAGAAWSARGPGELAAAMAGHPRIGERGLSAQSRQEQSGIGSGAATIEALREANAAYEDRFGYVFLICATGRGPDGILAELRRRMAHDPATELEVAAAEIGKINALRLRKLAAA